MFALKENLQSSFSNMRMIEDTVGLYHGNIMPAVSAVTVKTCKIGECGKFSTLATTELLSLMFASLTNAVSKLLHTSHNAVDLLQHIAGIN